MASRDLQVEMLPHLRHCYPELRERCNLEIVVEGTRIPLHVDILSKECSVFAKFFSAFDSSGDTSMGAAVTQLFQGADLPAALLTFLVVYKPDIFTLIQVFYGHTWGGGSAEEYGLPEIDCALLQRTFKLLDMIDARDVLDTLVNKMPTVVGTMVRADSVGWLETCGALEPAIRDHAVDHILQCIMNCPKESAGHVIGGRWADVPHPALLLLFEAMVRIARQGPHPDFWHIQNWRAMGDLYCGIFEDDEPSKWLQLSMRAFDAVTRPPMTLEEARVYLPRLVNEANGKPLVDWMIKDERWAEVPSHVLLIMMDALFLFALRGLPNERVMLTKADVAAWRGMGDLCRPYIEGTWEPEYPPDEVDSAFEEVQAFVDAEYASSAAPVVVYYREVIVVQHNGH